MAQPAHWAACIADTFGTLPWLHVMVEDQLRYILGIVDGHVRFAEAKNGAALAAAGALAVASVSILLSEDGVGLEAMIYLVIAALCSAISIVISVVSFLPRTHLPWLRALEAPHETDSLLFFGHIQKYNPEQFWQAITSRATSGDIPRMEFTYCEQIIINARIAARKFTLFKYSAWMLLAAIATPLGAVVVFWYVRDPDSD